MALSASGTVNAPSYIARPKIAPAQPISCNFSKSLMLLTPPEPIMSICVLSIRRFVAAKFGAYIIPARLMSV